MNEVRSIRLGMVNVYLLKGDRGYVLVDTGVKKHGKKILNTLAARGISPKEIVLIILTHFHPDHIGSLMILQKASGARVLIQEREYAVLAGEEDGIKAITFVGYLSEMISKVFMKRNSSKQDKIYGEYLTVIDILVDKVYSLEAFGIEGKVIHTPGHTKGSISVLLDQGDVIFGDNLMAFLPFYGPHRPFLAYSVEAIKDSVYKLAYEGGRRFFLSHGKDYSLERIKAAANRLY